MRNPAWMLACAALVLAPGCDDDEEQVARFPIEPRFLQYADTLSMAGTDTIWVGAQVGYDRCTLENARLEQHRDSLLVVGNARCVMRSGPQPGLVAAPSVPHAEVFPLRLPELAEGTYYLVAGAFVDTVVVSGRLTAPATRISALGSFVTPWLPCLPLGTVFFVDLQADVSLIYETVPDDSTPKTGSVRIAATRTGPSPCAPTGIAGRVHLRWFDLVADPTTGGQSRPSRTIIGRGGF